MSLIFWNNQLLFRDLGAGPRLAKDIACCCGDVPPPAIPCPDPDDVPSWWIQFTLPARCDSCCGSGQHTIELVAIPGGGWEFHDLDWCGSGNELYWLLTCGVETWKPPYTDVFFNIDFLLGQHSASHRWINPTGTALECELTATGYATDCCGVVVPPAVDEYSFDISITTTEP